MATKKRTKAVPRLPYTQRVGTGDGVGWRCWWIEAGKRRFGPKLATEQAAHEDGIRRRAALAAGESRMTLLDGVELLRRESAQLALATRAKYEQRIGILRRAFEDAKWLDSFSVADVEWYVARRLKGGGGLAPVSANTIVAHDLMTLSRIFAIALRRGSLPATFKDPVRSARLPRMTEGRRAVLLWDAAKAAIESIRAVGTPATLRYGDWLEFLLHTGLRQSELARIERKDIERGVRLHVRGKTGARVLPLIPRLDALLERMGAHEGDVHLLPGDTFARRWGSIREACRRTSVEYGAKVLPHTLRRTFATELRVRRVPREIISDLLGHRRSRDSMTDLYVKTFDPELHVALELLWDPSPTARWA